MLFGLTTAAFTITAFSSAFLAGLVGALVGLGGGIIVVPVLTLLLGVNIHHAVAASVVAVIATSSGSAVSYLRNRLANIRVSGLLEVSTTAGGFTGALLAGVLEARFLYLVFGAVILYAAYSMYQARNQELPQGATPDALSRLFRLEGRYYDKALGREVAYQAGHTLGALGILYGAGILAGLLGIGAGAFKVLAMDRLMKLPFKVSTATSNFMIGVTAAGAATVYLTRGDVIPAVAAPVALGVLAGATLGARVMMRLRSRTLRTVFVPLLVVSALQMLWKGWSL